MADTEHNISKYNGWTEAKKIKLLEWQRQSRLHSLGHGRAQEMYARKNNYILLPSISLGAIAVLFDGIALVWENHSVPFIIGALIITAIATILDGVLQATKPVEVAACHEDMAKGYNKIILQIDSMLTKDYDERENGIIFLTKIEKELISLKTGGVKIPLNIWSGVKQDFLEGECDFQKIKDDISEHRPFHHTIKMRADQTSDQLSAVHTLKTSTEPADTLVQEDINLVSAPDNVIDISGSGTSGLPTFELVIDNDPRTKRMEQMLYDFQINRFG